ncbi:MAG: hypothetical protein U0441_06735 [Polyangiaceae bacterium]
MAGALLLLMGANGDGCSGGDTGAGGSGGKTVAAPPTMVRADFGALSDFYGAPFPSEHRRRADGTIDIQSFPNPEAVGLVDKIAKIAAADSDGFGATSGVYFSLTGLLDSASLPDMRGSLKDDASVFLVSVDETSPDVGVRYPIKTEFEADGGPFGAVNQLTVLPYQGVPLRPETLYAAVIRRSVRDASGNALGPSDSLQALLDGKVPQGLGDAAAKSYQTAISWLGAHGVPAKEIAGLAVYRTGAPTAAFAKVKDAILKEPAPTPVKPFELTDVFDGVCVYRTTIKMPTYQGGTPPYDMEGGGWTFDANGDPVVQGYEEANFVVTLPRAPMPAAGFPIVVFSRTGAGQADPLFDHGPSTTGNGPDAPGQGPGWEFAKVGWAGSSIDGPHGGLRNVSGKDEQFLVFNFNNPTALRDNVRQSAVELVLHAHLLDNVSIDASACPGLTTPGGVPAKFDVTTMAAFGHSMGASIVPLALANEPRFKGAILSGAGSSYVANIVYKKKPLETKGLAELVLGYSGERELTEFDPVMSLLQWAAEPADTQVYARSILREPEKGAVHHVMMIEGVVDHYILPPIANTTALSLGLDLAGPELTSGLSELADFDALSKVLDLSGRAEISLPAAGNVMHAGGASSTAVVVQHDEDGLEDGHEAVFQSASAKQQYRCFLQSLAKGTPSVSTGADPNAACN